MAEQDYDVQRNEGNKRFEVISGGQISKLEYRMMKGKIALVHTEVPEDLSGQGIGSSLVVSALTYARENKLVVLPYCPFVASYVERHPEWKDVVGELE